MPLDVPSSLPRPVVLTTLTVGFPPGAAIAVAATIPMTTSRATGTTRHPSLLRIVRLLLRGSVASGDTHARGVRFRVVEEHMAMFLVERRRSGPEWDAARPMRSKPAGAATPPSWTPS